MWAPVRAHLGHVPLTAVRVQGSLAGAKVRGGPGIAQEAWETPGFSNSQDILLPLHVLQLGTLQEGRERADSSCCE